MPRIKLVKDEYYGRPDNFRPSYIIQAEKLAFLGLTQKEMSHFFHTTEQTLIAWKHRYPKFAEAIKSGGTIADANVAKSLYRRATGYTINTEKIFLDRNGEIVRATTTDHLPPETNAASLWLRNRRRQDWHDKKEIDHTITDKDKLETLTDADLERIINTTTDNSTDTSTQTQSPRNVSRMVHWSITTV